MPRPLKRVKSFGAVDLHFHGAFGIDLMTANAKELDSLSEELWKKGVAAFSATTLSASEKELSASVARLGAWIRSRKSTRAKTGTGAVPLGIHLEGPFLNPDAAGAHTPGILRKLTLKELENLWELSQSTLNILTIAPETLDDTLQTELGRWARKRKVRLSIGHTRCTEAQAKQALSDGFSGITHAWNAMSTHHREPGALGAAFGRKDTFIELIPDEVHVSASLIDWTLKLHPEGTFFVSDAAPAACTDGSHFHKFGDLECRIQNGAARLPNGTLAGGGFVLSEAFAGWIEREAKRKKIPALKLLKDHLHRIHDLPLQALFLKKSERSALLKKFPVSWEVAPNGKITAKPPLKTK